MEQNARQLHCHVIACVPSICEGRESSEAGSHAVEGLWKNMMVELGGDAKIFRSVENVSERSNADEAGRDLRELREGRSMPRGTS